MEWDNIETYDDFFFKIESFGESPLPTSGGVLDENVIIELPNGKKMFGQSYKGDLEGWRRKLMECCEANNLLWGKIEHQSIIVSDGQKFLLNDCKVTLS
jgi:hypothetical protein